MAVRAGACFRGVLRRRGPEGGLKGWLPAMGGGSTFRTTDGKAFRKVGTTGGLECFAFRYVAP